MEHINLEFFFNLEREGKKSIIDFCMKMGFIANSYECPECKKPMKLISKASHCKDGFVWRCKHQSIVTRTIRSGSWFEDSRLTLIQMLKLAYLWVKKTKYVWIFDELKISQGTVCDWMAFFRRVCMNAIKKEGVFIGGPNAVVEIDAKGFSRIKNQSGCETWVFGGVDRSTKKCFLEIIQSGEEDEIVSILQKYVLPGTTIISDNWKGFDCLESNGYVHQKVNKCFGFKDPSTGAQKNNILSLWARLKKILSDRIVNDQFDGYLAEIMWRRLHQEKTRELLMSFFEILSNIFNPRIRDDLNYISRKIEMENKKKEDCMKMTSPRSSLSSLEHEESNEVQDPILKEKQTQLKKVNGNSSEGESVGDMQIFENQFFEEIEVPLVYSACILSEDEVKDENESPKKRLKTMESFDT